MKCCFGCLPTVTGIHKRRSWKAIGEQVKFPVKHKRLQKGPSSGTDVIIKARICTISSKYNLRLSANQLKLHKPSSALVVHPCSLSHSARLTRLAFLEFEFSTLHERAP